MRTLTTEAGDLLLVEVPESVEVHLTRTGLVWYVDGVHHKDYRFTRDTMVILGPITKDGPQFDLAPFDGIYLIKSKHTKRVGEVYKCYQNEFEWYDNKKDSFISLLHSQGVYLENRSPHPVDINPNSQAHYDKLVSEWEQMQESTLKEGYKFIALLKTN